MKKILFILLASGILLLLFTHPATAAAGCTLGLKLWYTAVLPSLLPFLIISNLLVQTGLFQYLNRLYAPILSRIYRISDESCYAILMGLICGFPMGAKVVGDLVRQDAISTEEGTYLLGFCNNVSPAFFLNYVCLSTLGFSSIPWRLVLLFYGIPLFYGLVTRPFYHFPYGSEKRKQASLHRPDFPMLDACIMDGFTTITRLGGYIILFTILIQILKLFLHSELLLAAAGALLEVSSGIHAVAGLSGLSPTLKTALICSCASMGGLCICAQTQSVLSDSEPSLSIRSFLLGRMIITLLTLSLILVLLLYPHPLYAGQVLPGCL